MSLRTSARSTGFFDLREDFFFAGLLVFTLLFRNAFFILDYSVSRSDRFPNTAKKRKARPEARLLREFFFFLTLYIQNIKLQGGNWTFSKIYFRLACYHLQQTDPFYPLDKIFPIPPAPGPDPPAALL